MAWLNWFLKREKSALHALPLQTEINVKLLPTLRALRSNSSECPKRMASAGRISIKCFWTSVNIVVTFSSISAVIPLNLHKKKYHNRVETLIIEIDVKN